jgi:hypothetical protein
MVGAMTDPNLADDGDALLADYEASQKRRRLISVGVSVAVLAVLGGLYLWWRATGLPALDPKTTQSVSEALDNLDALPRDLHAMLAAEAMADLERERLPPAMVEAFESVSRVSPMHIDLIVMQPFAEDPDSLRAWTIACPAGASAIAAYTADRNIDKLFADCDLGRWSLIDGTAARRLSAGRLILAHSAWAWLVDHHSETELERRVLRVFLQG